MEIFAIVSILFSLIVPICAAILPIVILVGIGVFLYRRSKMKDVAKQAAQTWSSTMGTVITSTVQVKRGYKSRSEIPVVVYQYQVNGTPYVGKIIKAGEQYFSVRIYGDAQKTVARYPVGAQVMVYYNPANPAESALER